MRWTFETKYAGSDWVRSGKRFDTEAEAISAACVWAGIILENGEAVSVRIVRAD